MIQGIVTLEEHGPSWSVFHIEFPHATKDCPHSHALIDPVLERLWDNPHDAIYDE